MKVRAARASELSEGGDCLLAPPTIKSDKMDMSPYKELGKLHRVRMLRQSLTCNTDIIALLSPTPAIRLLKLSSNSWHRDKVPCSVLWQRILDRAG